MTLKGIQELLAQRTPNVVGLEQLPHFAVFLPLVERDGEWQVLFEQRALHLKRQPGEVCFPGGRIEKEDRNYEEAAKRETCEELGLSPGDLECFGPLDFLIESHRAVFPFVGQITHPERIRPNEDEVGSLFYIPLNALKSMKPDKHVVDLLVRPGENFPFDQIPDGRGYMWKRGKLDIYFYYYEDHIVWGLTARILHHFLELIG